MVSGSGVRHEHKDRIMASRKKKKPTPYAGDGSFIEFGVDALKDLIALLKPIMLLRATRKDLRSYHFKTDGEFVTISASDERVRLQVRHRPIRVSGSGQVMIDNHALQAMLGAFGEPRVRIHLDDAEETVRFEGLATKVQLLAYDPKSELAKPVPGCTERSGWMFHGPEFVRAIEMTKGFVDEDSQRYALGGLLFYFPTEAEGPCEIVSCDGRRLSRCWVQATAFNDPARFTRPRGDDDRQWSLGLPVVPIKAVMAARRIVKRVGSERIAMAIIPGMCMDLEKQEYAPGQVQIVTKEAVLTADCEPGRFPRYKDALPTEEIKCRIVIDDVTALRSTLAVATASTNSESKGVDITMAGGCMMFESESNTKGKARVSLTGLNMTGQGSFTADALYFRQFVDCLGHDPLVIDYRASNIALHFKSGTTWDGLLMPLTRGDDPTPASKPGSTHYNGTSEEDAVPTDEDGVVVDPYDPEDPDNGPKGGSRESVETSVEDKGPSHVEGGEPADIVVPIEATEPATVQANGHGSHPKPNRIRKKK